MSAQPGVVAKGPMKEEGARAPQKPALPAMHR